MAYHDWQNEQLLVADHPDVDTSELGDRYLHPPYNYKFGLRATICFQSKYLKYFGPLDAKPDSVLLLILIDY